MVDYGRAFKRPFDDLTALAIGIVLDIIPIVNFLVLGYQVKCAKTAMNKDYKMPKWGEWVKLFTSGLIVLVIGLIYLLPALIVMFATIGLGLLGILTSVGDTSGAMASLSLSSMGLGMVIMVALVILAMYVIPAAVLSYAKDDNIASAFKFKTIVGKVLKVNYLINWIISVAYSVVLAVILGIVPVIGLAAASFVTGVTSLTILAEVYSGD